MTNQNKKLYEFLNMAINSSELLGFLSLYNNYNDLFILENSEFFEDCFKKFPNLLILSPSLFKDNKIFIKSAIKVSASNVLFAEKFWNLKELKELVEINPFVSIYAIDFISKKEQNLLYLEAFKNTGTSTFLKYIEDESFKEDIFLDIYFNKLKCKKEISEDVLKEVEKLIKIFNEEELENIKNLKYN